jgi:hypothetical protein
MLFQTRMRMPTTTLAATFHRRRRRSAGAPPIYLVVDAQPGRRDASGAVLDRDLMPAASGATAFCQSASVSAQRSPRRALDPRAVRWIEAFRDLWSCSGLMTQIARATSNPRCHCGGRRVSGVWPQVYRCRSARERRQVAEDRCFVIRLVG